MNRLWSGVVGFARFWYGFIIGDDWMAAAGVAVLIGGTFGLLQAGIPSYWFGPVVIIAFTGLTLHRALIRRAKPAGP